jgi:sulfite exporter TauE/SafE
MCGGLVASVNRGTASLVSYHLGRLVGYSGLGMIAGTFGHRIFQSSDISVMYWVSAGLMALMFIYLGINLWFGKSIHFFRLPTPILIRLHKWSRNGAFPVGFFSAFLPCGWLQTFVLGAVMTQSAVLGGLYLFFFWLGTLPALSLAPWMTLRILRPVASKAPRIAGTLLITIGVLTLGVKIASYSGKRDCHSSGAPNSHSTHHHDHP